MEGQPRWLLSTFAGLVVVHATILLGYVVTCPDIRLRCLLADQDENGVLLQEVVIHRTPAKEVGSDHDERPERWYGSPVPQVGDRLLQINETQIVSFADFTHSLSGLRSTPPEGGVLPEGSDPSELPGIPSHVAIGEQGPRYVKVDFIPHGTQDSQSCWLLVQSLPSGDVLLSFVWFLLQLTILAISVLAVWHRPFDRPARLFFMMCALTLVAFVGGVQWWITAANLWLNLPFAACAILLPAVTLHFFMTYPRPRVGVSRHRIPSLLGIYAIPLLTAMFVAGMLIRLWWLNDVPASATTPVEKIFEGFLLLRQVIYAYILYAGLCFGVMLAALAHGFFTMRDPIERSQIRLIFMGGIFATIPIGYTLWLALLHRVDFALGDGTQPMFLASLSFMLAYAVAIARYKLMLVDQLLTKGMRYYSATLGLTLAYAAAIALCSLLAIRFNVSPSPQQVLQQTLAIGAVLMLTVVFFLWLRDGIQRMIDGWFYREKYQLDRAFQRMNRAAGHLVDRQSLAERMLSSCRDVLRIHSSALYLREPGKDVFQLVAAFDLEDIPVHFTPDEQFLIALAQDSTLQRVTTGRRGAPAPVQSVLRHLQAHVVHALEIDGTIAGFVVLGGKQNNSSFTAEDLTFLNALGQVTSIAMHSARVHQDITRLNEELRRKVDKIANQSRQISILQNELNNSHSEHDLPPVGDFQRGFIKGRSSAIAEVLDTARKVAVSNSSVLVRGESGTGKELIAQAIHENSNRRKGPLVRVHCAALAPSLLESELFGHVKGAFTGAHQDRIGRFEAAQGGTIFLDEIGDVSHDTQIKLLRVLQERCFERVGGAETIHVDVRIVAATHQNLERLIFDGKFREDLYYRLNVISLTMPPLRERREDVFELAFHFLRRAAERVGKTVTSIDDATVSLLERHHWPGNIRELENAIERAVVLAEGDSILPQHLPDEVLAMGRVALGHAVGMKPVLASPDGRDVRQRFSESERETLAEALRDCGGNKAQAARQLGMPRSTYYSKLKKYSIE